MSGKSVLVLLAVNVLLVQTKPAAIENVPSSKAAEQNLDSLIDQLRQIPTTPTPIVVAAQDASGTVGIVDSQHTALRELLKNRSFVEQLIEFLKHFQQIFQILPNGQSGSLSQNTQSFQGQSTSTAFNEATLRGLFNNPSFLNFLSGFLQNGEGSSFFSQLLGNQAPVNNAAAHTQQETLAQSHASGSQFSSSQLSSYLQNGHVPQVPSIEVNSADSSNHVESDVVKNPVTSSQHNFVEVPGISTPLVVESSHAVNNVVPFQESSIIADNVDLSHVINGHSRPVIADVPQVVLPQNTHIDTVSSVVSESSNIAQAPFIEAEKPWPSDSVSGSIGNGQIQTEAQAPVLDARFGELTHGVNEVIITQVDDNAASSATSNVQQTVVNTSSVSSDNQAVQSSEALLNQLNGYHNNAGAVVSQDGITSHTNSYHAEQSSQVNVNGIPQVPILQNMGLSNNVLINEQQQISQSQQSQASNINTPTIGTSVAVRTSENLLEELRKNLNKLRPLVPQVEPQPSWSVAQHNGDTSGHSFHSGESSHSSQVNGRPGVTIIHSESVVPVQISSGLQNIASSSESQSSAYRRDEIEARRQAQNANYQFATQVNDNINGNFQQRAEIREGARVYGKYSYDDGFVWRTVYYQADENGYKVTREDVSPSRVTSNVNGEANVQTMNNGNLVNYHITRKDIGARKQNHQQQYGIRNQQQYGVTKSQ